MQGLRDIPFQRMAGANVATHAGLGGGMGFGMGRGRGMGRGMGMGMRSAVQSVPPTQPEVRKAPESGLAELREELKSLRRQLAETMERIEQLDKKS